MKKILFTGFICVLCVGSVFAQNSKPWNEWSKKDAEKILNSSAWAQSQIKGEAPPSTADRDGRAQTTNRDPGAPRPPSEYFLRVRFITAKPIREAFARKVLLSQQNPTKELQDQLQADIDQNLGDFIVVAVDVDGQDPRTVSGILRSLTKMTKETLDQKVFLERSDKKRLHLIEYRPPGADNIGGKFIFARTLDGVPYLSPDIESVRFAIDVEGGFKLSMKFKVSKMMYGEKLEY